MTERRIDTGHEGIRATIHGSIATLAVASEQKRNAVSLGMWQAIPSAVTALDADPETRVIVVRGAGEAAFVSGADISEFATVRRDAASGRAYEAANEAAFAALAGARHPTLAIIHGPCMGGGLGLALSCDIRIAAPDAVFAIPAGKLGVGYPPAAMKQLVATLSPAVAKFLFFSGRRIDAEEALRLGVVAQIHPKAELTEAGLALAGDIAALAPLTLHAAKRAIDAASGTRPAEAGELRRLADRCFDSADYAEGRAAFLEKRAPRFEGR